MIDIHSKDDESFLVYFFITPAPKRTIIPRPLKHEPPQVPQTPVQPVGSPLAAFMVLTAQAGIILALAAVAPTTQSLAFLITSPSLHNL